MSEDIGLNHSDKGGQSAVKEPVPLPDGEGPFLSEQDKQASVASPFLPLFTRRVPGKAVFFRNTPCFPDRLSVQAITQAFTDQQGSGIDHKPKASIFSMVCCRLVQDGSCPAGFSSRGRSPRSSCGRGKCAVPLAPPGWS